MKQDKKAEDTEAMFEVGRKLVEAGQDPILRLGNSTYGKAAEKGRKAQFSPAKGEPGHYRQIAI